MDTETLLSQLNHKSRKDATFRETHIEIKGTGFLPPFFSFQ